MITETIGQRVKRLREAKGLTLDQTDVGAFGSHRHPFCKVTQSVENGCDSFNLPTYVRLANLFGVTLSYLLEGDPVANTPGKRIRQRRDELGLPIAQLASKASMSLYDICLIECDEMLLKVHSGYLIGVALGVTPEWIKTGQEPKFPPKYAGHFEGMPETCITKVAEHDSVTINFCCKSSEGKKIADAFIKGEAYKSLTTS